MSPNDILADEIPNNRHNISFTPESWRWVEDLSRELQIPHAAVIRMAVRRMHKEEMGA